MPVRHVVAQGEGISSISERYGFAPWTIWDDPANGGLRELRKDGDVLMAGDVLVVPDRREGAHEVKTGARHVFRKRGVPAKMRLQLFRNRVPRRHEEYALYVDGALRTRGITDDSGVLDVFVPPGAKEGRIVVGEDRKEMLLAFGHLDPITEPSGVRKRMENLGLLQGGAADDAAIAAALSELQEASGLPVTGLPDAATLEKLAELHDREGTFGR